MHGGAPVRLHPLRHVDTRAVDPCLAAGTADAIAAVAAALNPDAAAAVFRFAFGHADEVPAEVADQVRARFSVAELLGVVARTGTDPARIGTAATAHAAPAADRGSL